MAGHRRLDGRVLHHLGVVQQRQVGGAVRVGQVGSQGADALESAGRVYGVLVAGPGDGGLPVFGLAGVDGDESDHVVGDDLGDSAVDVGFGPVERATAAVADPTQGCFGFGHGSLAGGSNGGGFFGRVDVGDAQVMAGSVGGADGEGAE
jgi:hypothetical protein